MKEIVNRIQSVADYFHKPFAHVMYDLGYSRSTADRVKMEHEIMNIDRFVEKALKVYPELNPSWIKYGVGEMWKTDFFESRFNSIESKPKDSGEVIQLLSAAFMVNQSQLALNLGIQRCTIHRLAHNQIVNMSDRLKGKITASMPFIKLSWLP